MYHLTVYTSTSPISVVGDGTLRVLNLPHYDHSDYPCRGASVSDIRVKPVTIPSLQPALNWESRKWWLSHQNPSSDFGRHRDKVIIKLNKER